MKAPANRDTVLLVGIGSFHARFVAENAGRFPAIRWVWAQAAKSVWAEENERAEANADYLLTLGVAEFDPEKDPDRLLGVMILTGNGRLRIEEYERWSCFGRPIYLDKPYCTTVQEGRALVECSVKCGVPWVTGSSMRFQPQWKGFIDSIRGDADYLQLQVPWPLRSGREGWCWYGVHGVELLAHAFAADDVEAVCCGEDAEGRVLQVKFSGGSLGEIRENDDFGAFRAVARLGDRKKSGTFSQNASNLYGDLMVAVIGFFQQGKVWYSKRELENTAKVLQFGWQSQQTGGMRWIRVSGNDC